MFWIFYLDACFPSHRARMNREQSKFCCVFCVVCRPIIHNLQRRKDESRAVFNQVFMF